MREVVLTGRGYPTAETAVKRLTDRLAKDDVDPIRVYGRRWTEKSVMCPWEAVAEVSDADYARIVR